MADVARFAAGPKIRKWADQNKVSDWMAARWIRMTDDGGRLLDGMLRKPPQYLRVNPLRGELKEVKKRLSARGFELVPSDLDPMVLRVRQAPLSAGATIEHLLGQTTLQDVSSASAPLALGAQPGDIVADLAAAPGIKTLHMAGDMHDLGAIVAVEPDESRMRALSFNLERTGVTSAWLRQSTAQEVPGEAWADRVLLDAPCTGEGTIPKDTSRRIGTPEEISDRADLQTELLAAADRILKPGGTLVYATCTLAPEENECQLQPLLQAGYKMETLPFDACGKKPLAPGITDWPTMELDSELAKARRFLPGIHPSLGFFVAKLTKEDS